MVLTLGSTIGFYATHTSKQVSPEVEVEVVQMRQTFPDWGKQRIRDELAKANNWVPVVSVNTMRRILQEAGL